MPIKYSNITNNRSPSFSVYRPVAEQSASTFTAVSSIIGESVQAYGLAPEQEEIHQRAVLVHTDKIRRLTALSDHVDPIALALRLETSMTDSAYGRLAVSSIVLGVAETVYADRSENYGSFGIIAASVGGNSAILSQEQHKLNEAVSGAYTGIKVASHDFPFIEFASIVTSSEDEHYNARPLLHNKFHNVTMGGIVMLLDPTVVEVFTNQPIS